LTFEQREDRVASCQDMAMADANKNYYRRWDLVFCLWPRNKATDFEWVGETSPWPKKLKFQFQHQNHVDKFFHLSKHSAQRTPTRGKNCKCRNL
jgi:hypothetical protein